MCAVDLVESPKQILGCAVYIIAARVIWKVVAERRSRELRLEQIDLVQEEDDAGPHEPPAIYYRVEQHQAFHHAILEVH